MRRKDKEIKDKALIESIIKKAFVCRIALCEDGKPYIVPVNFGYKDGCIYIHSAREGRKIDVINKNNNICFEIGTDIELIESEVPCDWSVKYYSAVGFGKAQLVYDINDKKKALDIIMEKYSNKGSFEYNENMINNVVIIKIEMDSITGKKSGY